MDSYQIVRKIPDLQKIGIANPKLLKGSICIVIKESWVLKDLIQFLAKILKIFKRFNLFTQIFTNP
jgi:flagellar biosynthesis protein FliQ